MALFRCTTFSRTPCTSTNQNPNYDKLYSWRDVVTKRVHDITVTSQSRMNWKLVNNTLLVSEVLCHRNLCKCPDPCRKHNVTIITRLTPWPFRAACWLATIYSIMSHGNYEDLKTLKYFSCFLIAMGSGDGNITFSCTIHLNFHQKWR